MTSAVTQLLVPDLVHTADPDHPHAEAVLVRGGTIAAVGSVADLTGPGIREQRLPGRTIVPGLIESHVHPIYTGLTNDWADCRSPQNADIADVLDRLRAAAEGTTGWVRGWGYDDTLLAEDRHPTRAELDTVSRERPVIVQHISGHFVVANTAALDAAGITETTVAQDDPRFPRDDDGRLTGLGWEIEGVSAILDVVPQATDAEVDAALLRALRLARSRGITTLNDLGLGLFAGPAERAAYERLVDQLPVTVVAYLRGDLALAAIERGEDPFGPIGQRARVAGAKFWTDGSIQGLSAALQMPYACAPDHTGDLLIPQEELDRIAETIHRAGGQIAMHANGDAAVHAATQALVGTRAVDERPVRHRIEHCQVTSDTDLRAIRDAGLAVSFFINHVYYWGDRHRDRFLGPQRAAAMDGLAAADALGMRFGLHSDCPITPMDPLRTMRTAATRRTSGGTVLGPDERISPERALRAMTTDSAYLTHDETRVGMLRPGMRADLVVLDAPLETLADESAPVPGVEQVMVAGRFED
ncbi:amidohydrolase [Calidifontibacter sp. DB0510]|uniref:Amidohydrolase n=1 Tax=Metallococcus carri TaxID=1656884 RepID=A0A967AZU2_9MICO|nr:amidohydrolase [Metallococcus carri]NHN54845.1 amidohydrolase [Metallococcus carri]NOP37190.1 amidohydrolase [Calidifontibacter sp. DB2511S]